MNRTSRATLLSCLLAAAPGLAQAPAEPPVAPQQVDPVAGIVEAMRAAEGRLQSLELELRTSGSLPGGVEFTTRGTLRVLRGTQSKLHAAVRFRFADGLQGEQESLQDPTGITLFTDDPAFGRALVQIAPAVVADLEWAGGVLAKADLPGMADARAAAPLGSAMLADLARRFALQVTNRKDRAGDAGTWLAGARRAAGDDTGELPLPTRVEAFVRAKDQALLEVVHYQGDAVLQRITVERCEVGVKFADTAFQVDPRGLSAKAVDQFPPLWEEIKQVLLEAESKAAEKRPSQRK